MSLLDAHEEQAPGPALEDGPPEVTWPGDHVSLALRGSTVFSEGRMPGAFCTEVGRRLLLAELQFPQWVLRRVEKITFQDERNVVREILIDLRVRDDAPLFVDGDERYWLVPITVMRRRTLVDFHITREDGQPVSTPGLRLVQQLDQSILRAAADTAIGPAGPGAAGGADVDTFVHELIAGTKDQVGAQWERYDESAGIEGDPLAVLRRSPGFHRVARQMRSGFSMYVFLPVEDGRHRLLRMSFVEPIRWRYQQPRLWLDDRTEMRYEYRALRPPPFHRRPLRTAAALGWTATRLRLQVPSAERAASYHLELVAPTGVRIGKATLIAGRPNEARHPAGTPRPESDPEPRLTADHEESDALMVGLHGVEVPPGSLCRAQVDLRVQSAGWLGVMALAGIAICAVLASVAWHVATQESPGEDQANNVVVLLLTTAAAAATFVAHREFGGVAARLLTGVRVAAAACMALPVVAAGFIAYTERPPTEPPEPSTLPALVTLTVAAAVLALQLAVVWCLSRRLERAGRPRSPWDMTTDTPSPEPGWIGAALLRHRARLLDWAAGRPGPVRRLLRRRIPWGGAHVDFLEAVEAHGFDLPAMAVRSSEAWHESYDITDARHEEAVQALEGLARAPAAGFPCADPAACPHRAGDNCRVSVSRTARGGGTPDPPAPAPRRVSP
ncbi:hypothetical protein ACI8AC_10130 [Geodermatophilus sp. SYSU D00758]